MLQVWYDDYEITQHCIVRKIAPTLSAPITNNFLSLSHLNGANFKFSSLGQIELKVDITIKDNIQYHLDELNKVLNVKEPKKLIISDRKDRYLMCKLNGKVDFSSRFIASDATMTFISPDHYWTSTDELKRFVMSSDGRILVTNNGSASTPPIINVDFSNDCGYFALIGPESFLTLGNPKELDNIPVPPTESALNEEMHSLSGWTRVTDVENWVTDYNKITSKGTAKHDEYGTLLNPSTFTGLANNWQGHAYVKQFNMGSVERKADNFKLRSRVVMHDTAGNRNSTAGMLIVVLDDENRPIMTASIYDSTTDRKKLATSFKINSFRGNDEKHSTIIHNGSIDALNGFIEMRKAGNKFEWLIHTDSVNVEPVPVKVGDKVKLKPSATKAASGHYYRSDYKNRQYTVTAITTWPGHSKKIYALSIGAHVIYHVYLDDIQQATVTTSTGPKQVRHSIVNNSLAQLNPSKVLIWQGVWGNTTPYSRFSLNSVVVDRLYTTNTLEIENVFRPGDNLQINHQTGDILLNGTTYQGFADYDNRFFEIDWGDTELQVVVSDWAQYPSVELLLEERYL